jgi:hypothetical protein
MSTAPQPAFTPPAKPGAGERNEVMVVSHSNLFYWWPVWAIAFLMALLTLIDGYYMVTVPAGTEPRTDIRLTDKGEAREGWVLPKDDHLVRTVKGDSSSLPQGIGVHMSRNKNYGVIFCMALILVIVITNVPLRGMWSLVVIITIILLSVIFALAGWWETIFEKLGRLDIRINMGAYMFIGVALFAVWFFTLMFFDKQVYIIFTPGQFKVCTEIGGGEKVYDTIGLTLERQKADLFRHYILGLGSGDLVVKTTGAQAHHFDLPNVLFINKKVQMIEDLLQKKKVVETR